MSVLQLPNLLVYYMSCIYFIIISIWIKYKIIQNNTNTNNTK